MREINEGFDVTVEDEDFEIRLKRREELRKKRRRIRRIKQKVMCFAVLTLVLAILVGCVVFIFTYPHRKVEENFIVRDLSKSVMYIDKLDAGKDQKYLKCDVPSFVAKDFSYAERTGKNIKYHFNDYYLNGFVENGIWYLSIDSLSFFMALPYEFLNPVYDVSIFYSNKEKALVIYGYSKTESNLVAYNKLLLYEDKEKLPIGQKVSDDINLPVGMEISFMDQSVNFGNYTLFFDGRSSTFEFYQDQEVISSFKFNDSVAYYDSDHGYVLTTNGILYKIYIYLKDGKPSLRTNFVATDVDFMREGEWETLRVLVDVQGKNYIPVIVKNNNFFAVYPKDMDAYEKYGSFYPGSFLNDYMKDQDYDLDIIDLKKVFSYAEFDYSSYWMVNFYFNINGRMYATYMMFDGYDTLAELNEYEIETLSIHTENIDDVWPQIEKIRDSYQNHCTHSFYDIINK